MKKIIATIILTAVASVSLFAVKAPETPIQYRQPDGSVVTIVKHGDEFHHWTTMNGQVVKLGPDGYWRPVANQSAFRQASAKSIQKRRNAQEMVSAARESSIRDGEKHFLVVLIEFSDLAFTVENANSSFANLLNQEGYSANGGTGSVKDYYEQNSKEQFKPIYDVYGPVKVSKSYAYYGKNDSDDYDEHPDEALYEACVLLDSQVDFSIYDHDGDRVVDNVFFYYAGHNEAEHASEDTIWPHAYALYGFNSVFDGVRVSSYACTSEYRGASGQSMCGIGTFCHEFGHVLGLPDFYDTDYAKHGTALHMGSFSLMAGGNYNNNGRTPPYLTAVERNILNWMDGYSSFRTGALNEAIEHTIDPIHKNVAFRLDTFVEGEYFLFETRDGTGWDAFLPKGLLVYHVDQSDNLVENGMTAKYLWKYTNDFNAYAVHPCCYPIASSVDNNPSATVFPGTAGVTSLTLKAWNEDELSPIFSNIAFSDGKISLLATLVNNFNLAKIGFSSIANPKNGKYSAGDKFELSLLAAYDNAPTSVEWYWDGTKQSGTSVTVTAGKHTVLAKLTYANAETEDITLEITAN